MTYIGDFHINFHDDFQDDFHNDFHNAMISMMISGCGRLHIHSTLSSSRYSRQCRNTQAGAVQRRFRSLIYRRGIADRVVTALLVSVTCTV